MKNVLMPLSFILLLVAGVYGANGKPYIASPSVGMDDVDPKQMNSNLIQGKAGTDQPVATTNNSSKTLNMSDELEPPILVKPKSGAKQPTVNAPKDTYGYQDEVILNWIMRSDMEAKNKVTAKNKKDAYKVSFYTPDKNDDKKDESVSKKNLNQDANQTKIDGFSTKCLVNKDHTIRGVKATKLIEVTCKNNDNIYVQLGIELIPDNDNYALLGKARYYIDEKGKYYILDSEKSMVHNFDGSDTNIASNVNLRTLEKFNATAQKELAKGMSESAKEYMEEDKTYRANQGTSVITSSGTVVTSSNAVKPDLGTNVIYGLTQGVLGIWDKTADAITTNLPYLYEVKKGSLLNVFAVISTTTQKTNTAINKQAQGSMK